MIGPLRRELEGRPLVPLLLGLVIGLTAILHPSNLLFLLPVLVLASSVRSWVIVAGGLVLGLVLAPAGVRSVAAPTYVQGSAHILSVPRDLPGSVVCDADVDDLRARLLFPIGTNVHLGERWSVSGVVKPASEGSEAWYQEQGLQGAMKVSRAERLAAGPAVFALADAWRSGFERFTHSWCRKDDAEWLDSICFRSGNLSTEERADLQMAGNSYLVAASGLHVYVLAGLVVGILGLVRSPRAVQVVAVCAVLALYCLATGIHITTVRASLACVAFLAAYLVRREPDALSALALSGSVYLLAFPWSVFSLGFQLSMLVATAVALFMPRVKSTEPTAKARIGAYVVSAGWVAAIVLLAGQPLIALYTGKLSLAQIPVNVITGAAAPVAIGLCFLAYSLQPVSHALAEGVLQGALPLVAFIRAAGLVLGGWGPGLDLPGFSPYWLVGYYGLWLATWRPRAIPA